MGKQRTNWVDEWLSPALSSGDDSRSILLLQVATCELRKRREESEGIIIDMLFSRRHITGDCSLVGCDPNPGTP